MRSYYIYIHYKTVVHHDLKPANILINSDYKVKLCDFGMSRIDNFSSALLSSVGKKKTRGTPMYMASELLLNIEKGTVYSDMWAHGCTVIEVFKE